MNKINQTPLLLKYKICNCVDGTETWLDFNDDGFIGDWTSYGGQKHESWKLQMPDSDDFIMDSDGDVLHFNRYEYYANGDGNPVIIEFQSHERTERSASDAHTCRLPENYIIGSSSVWNSIHNADAQSILCEYERQRDRWQTRVVMWRDDR